MKSYQRAITIITAKRDFDLGQSGCNGRRSRGCFLKIVNGYCQEIAKKYEGKQEKKKKKR